MLTIQIIEEPTIQQDANLPKNRAYKNHIFPSPISDLSNVKIAIVHIQ